MYLHARAIELVFECRFAEFRKRRLNILRRLRQHGLNRPEELDVVGRESRDARFQRGARHAGDITGHHGGAADLRDGDSGGLRERVQHDAFEGALTDLAEQKAGEEALFGFGGAREECVQQVAAAALRSRALDRGEFGQGGGRLRGFRGPAVSAGAAEARCSEA